MLYAATNVRKNQNYSSQVEFRDKISKQLEIQLRTLIAEQADGAIETNEIKPITDIVINFSDNTGTNKGTELEVTTSYFEVSNFDEIPDFTQEEETTDKTYSLSSLNRFISSNINKDYYRQMATYIIERSFYQPLRFWFKNRGGVGARDVYIDITLQSEGNSVILVPKNVYSTSSPSKVSQNTILGGGYLPNNPSEIIRDGSDVWNTNIEIRALQPQRELSPNPEISVGSRSSCEIVIQSRIFADTLPEPVIQELKLKLKVDRVIFTAEEMMTLIGFTDKEKPKQAPKTQAKGRVNKSRRSL